MNGLESQPTSTRARYGVAFRYPMMDVMECSQMLLPTSTRARYGAVFRSPMMDVVECSQMLLPTSIRARYGAVFRSSMKDVVECSQMLPLICLGLRSERKRVDMCETDKAREKLNTIQICLGVRFENKHSTMCVKPCEEKFN